MMARRMPADTSRRPLDALNRVLASVDAVRNAPALGVLLGTFSLAGLLMAMARSTLAREALAWAVLEAGAALTVAFYGGNAVGVLTMDQAAGRPIRPAGEAVREALRTAHRLLLVLLAVVVATAAALAALAALLALARLPVVGAPLFGLALPAAVIGSGTALLAGVAVVGPLSGPAIWAGFGVRETLRLLLRLVRRRLVFVALLVAAASLLAGAVGLMTTFVVLGGARVTSLLAPLAAGIELPPGQLMAGVFGLGPRSLSAVGPPVLQSAQGVAALVGGGVVFVLALVLPGLVYLRGLCAVLLALTEDRAGQAEGDPAQP